MPRGSYQATKRTAENDTTYVGDTNESEGTTNSSDEQYETIAGFTAVNPGDVTGDSGNGDSPKRRGRKPGTKNKPKNSTANLTAGLESLLLSVHQIGASFLSMEELALDEKEAKLLADAIQGVAEHYPLTLDPKYLAVGNLVMVGVGIYGTRIFAYRNRMKREQNKNIDVIVDAPVNGAATPTNIMQWPILDATVHA